VYKIKYKDGDDRDYLSLSVTKLLSNNCEEFDLMECERRLATKFETKEMAENILKSFSLNREDYRLIHVNY
jgi:hypothetical protein